MLNCKCFQKAKSKKKKKMHTNNINEQPNQIKRRKKTKNQPIKQTNHLFITHTHYIVLNSEVKRKKFVAISCVCVCMSVQKWNNKRMFVVVDNNKIFFFFFDKHTHTHT